eukprot:TRINITY_DN9659_c0_g1_i1.p1 TRINITY_DN9659_c0_g1~~TRINITY_DN9659_c0_g1_i1.p1  ORF type:complete len:277 (-),score=21.18 TRINITY_DN9659_c0_g1_i1:63-893(-)
MFRNRRGNSNAGLIFLAIEIARIGIDNIPPVTLAVLALNVCIYLFNPLDHDIGQICILPSLILSDFHNLSRLIFAPFYHLHDYHLYYNMSSLLLKGRTLEPIVGSFMFGCLVAVFSIACSIALVGLSYILTIITGDISYNYTCTAGFSAVLFALKVVVNDRDPDSRRYLMGIPVQTRYLAWAELLLIHLLVPQSSFLGHLSGIIIGYAYKFGLFNPVFSILQSFNAPREPHYSQHQSYNDGTQRYRTYRREDYPTNYVGQRNDRPIIRNGVLHRMR